MSLKLKHNSKPLNLTLNSYSDNGVCLSDRLPGIKPLSQNLPSSLNHISSPSNSVGEIKPRNSRKSHSTLTTTPFMKEAPTKSHFLPPIQLHNHGSAPTVSQNSFEKPLKTWSNSTPEPEDKPIPTSSNRFMFMPGFTMTQEQSKEECKVRYGLVKSNMQELCSMEVIDGRNKYYYEKEYIAKDTERACKLAESVLSAMGVQVRSFVGNAMDSSMLINPIKEKVRLAYFYKLFIPEMCQFNYIFLSKLRLNTISVCESVRLQSKEYLTVLNQKLHNGLFPLEKMVDRKSVQQHWFKVVLYHFIKLAPDAYAEWQEILKEHETGKVKAFEELLASFNYMMGIDRELYEKHGFMKMKENFLREKFTEYGLMLDGDETRKHRDE